MKFTIPGSLVNTVTFDNSFDESRDAALVLEMKNASVVTIFLEDEQARHVLNWLAAQFNLASRP